MSLKSAPYYWVECDACGANAQEATDFTAMGDAGSAIDNAINIDWITVEGETGEVYICNGHGLNPELCPECEGDLDDSATTATDAEVIQHCPHCHHITTIPLTQENP